MKSTAKFTTVIIVAPSEKQLKLAIDNYMNSFLSADCRAEVVKTEERQEQFRAEIRKYEIAEQSLSLNQD
jgi:hypothetical protein